MTDENIFSVNKFLSIKSTPSQNKNKNIQVNEGEYLR